MCQPRPFIVTQLFKVKSSITIFNISPPTPRALNRRRLDNSYTQELWKQLRWPPCGCFTASSSLPPLLCPKTVNQRVALSLTVNRRRCDIGINKKISSFCPKASLRGNLEATGVPTSVPVRVAHELLQAGHRYLDVRTPEEFSAGHASGAINVPYVQVGSGMAKNPEFLKEVSSQFGKYDEIIVGCQMGKRSLMAATDLLAAGFTSITDIAGGYVASKENGLPTEP